MTKMMYSLLFLTIVSIFLLAGFLYQYVSTKYNDWHNPPPGQFVVVNNRKIHFLCTGESGPTVILDAGLGADLNWWHLVQKEISNFARVCSFDRPGYGWSDSSECSRTSKQIVSELHALLDAAGLEEPYILVGHSFGGANMRLYANTYPERIAGLILVDACHENQSFVEDLSRSSIFTMLKQYVCSSSFSHYFGISRWGMKENLKPFFSSLMSQELQNIIIAKASSIKALRAQDNEMLNLNESLKQLKDSKNALLDKPLIVITAEETNKDLQWQECQKELVSLSILSKQIIVEKSSHMVHVDRPEVVIDAIKEMIKICKKV